MKLFLCVSHSAAPIPYNCVAALVLYEPRGSVRGLLAAVDKQDGWCENLYVFIKLTNRVIYLRSSLEACFGLKNASKSLGSNTKTIAVNVGFLQTHVRAAWRVCLRKYDAFGQACFLPLE